MSPEKIENEIKFILTAKKSVLLTLKLQLHFFLFKKIPSIPKKKIMAPRDK